MSGYALLTNITADEIDEIRQYVKRGVNLTQLEHGPSTENNGIMFSGWTSKTRAALEQAQREEGIPNRNDLPPHFYIEFPDYNDMDSTEKSYFLNTCQWVNRLVYPPNMGLKIITSTEQRYFRERTPLKAFIEGRKKRNRHSIEVYKINGQEVTQKLINNPWVKYSLLKHIQKVEAEKP